MIRDAFLPAKCRQFEPRADPDHQIGLWIILVPGRAIESVWRIVTDDAAPAAKRNDRRLDQARKLGDFVFGMNSAAADIDHRICGRFDHRGRAFDAHGIRRNDGARNMRRFPCRRKLLPEDIHGHFERDGLYAAAREMLEGPGDDGRRIGRVIDP